MSGFQLYCECGGPKRSNRHWWRPARRDAEKIAKVAKALDKGLSVGEIVTLTGISRASVKRYRQELAAE